MNKQNGKKITGFAHLEQSISDILSTPIGTRVMRREYGSKLPELLDRPMNGELTVDIFAATADAISKWEPRFKLKRIQVTEAGAGRFVLSLSGKYLPAGQDLKIEGVRV